MLDAFLPSESDRGIIINWFPSETIRPVESHDDGGIIIGGFPTETVRVDDIAVDPNNPNVDVDGRDFLYWQRGNATGDGLLLPAVQTKDAGGGEDWTVIVVTDHGLLLPAVRMDGGEAGIQDGTSNTFKFGEVVPHSPHTGGVNALLCDGSVRVLNDGITADYNPYVTVDYLL